MKRAPFPDFVLHERIGEGGIADVFRATWLQGGRGREVALKVLRDPDRPGLRARFLREGRILEQLDHPGLVRCHGIIDLDPPAIILELLQGEGLDARIARGPMGGEEGVHLTASLLRTLGFLHDRGIVHRDVKPGNIFLTKSRRIVLLDLGLAAEAHDPVHTTLGQVIGTWAYMAPEQIAGAESDHRADLYALGITLYEALSGRRPFEARGLIGWLEAHRQGGAASLLQRAPDLPVRLGALVDRMMGRDPAGRPGSTAVALAQLTGTAGLRRALETPPLVGREAAHGAIAALLDVGGLLRIYGELGSGLGVVARMARTLAREGGIEFATIRCRGGTRAQDARLQLAREIAQTGDAVPPHDEALRRALDGLAGEGGFLLVVEDVDLATPDVTHWVDALVGIPGLAVVVTGTGLEASTRTGRTLALRPLQAAEVRAIVTTMLGTPSPPNGLDIDLHRVCGGLPALVVALLREQVAQGACQCEGIGEDGAPRWTWDRTAPLDPGEDTARVFARALDQLPSDTRRLVGLLGVAGVPVPLTLALAAARLDASGLALGPAVRGGILDVRVEGGEEWVRLRRAVLEPLVTASMDEDDRAAVHAALAEGAGHRPAGDWERRFIATQVARAAPDPAHTELLVRLAGDLVTSGQTREALEVLEAAARLPATAGTSARLALARGDALLVRQRLGEARAAIDAARTFADAAGDADVQREVALAHADLALSAGVAWSSDLRAFVVAMGQAHHLRGMILVAELLSRDGRPAEARAWADAVRASPQTHLLAVARARAVQITCLLEDGRAPEARTEAHLLGAQHRAEGRLGAACAAVAFEADACVRLGDLAGAHDALAALETLARGNADAWGAALLGIARARVATSGGDTSRAETWLRTHAAAGAPGSPWSVRRAWLVAQSELREALGDAPSALAAHLRVADAAGEAGEVVLAALHRGVAAVYSARAEGPADALALLRALGNRRSQARLLLLGGRVGRDRELLARAADLLRGLGDTLLLLEALHALGGAAERVEARGIVAGTARGLHGPFRAAFEAQRACRWARAPDDAG